MTEGQRAPSGSLPTCYRHTDRQTGIRCQRCERPICPDCMRDAAVGFQCPSCIKEGAKSTRQNEAAYGGRRSADPRRTSQILMGLNVAVFIAIVSTGSYASPILQSFALQPFGVATGSWWTILTSAFTHVSVLHLVMNLVGLQLLGPAVEQALGRARFLAVYAVSVLTSGAAVMWLSSEGSATIGASGAVYGLMAALLVIAIKRRRDTRPLFTLIGINVAISIVGYAFISWQGHLGGFVGGALITAAVVWAPRARRTPIQVGAIVAVSLLAVLAIVLRIADLSARYLL